MFHRSMYLGRFYKSTLRLASSQNLIKATACDFVSANLAKLFKYCKYLYWYFSGGSLSVEFWCQNSNLSGLPRLCHRIYIEFALNDNIFDTWTSHWTRSKQQTLTAYLNKISCNPFGCGRFFVRVNLIIFKKAWFIYIICLYLQRRLITSKRDVI